jgi:hypothetical protein
MDPADSKVANSERARSLKRSLMRIGGSEYVKLRKRSVAKAARQLIEMGCA